MEATIMLRYMLGLYWDNGKENGSYYSNIGFYESVSTLVSGYADESSIVVILRSHQDF